MSAKKKFKECIKRNKLGDCLQYKEIGDRIEVSFNDEAKKCNPDLYEEYQKKFLSRKIDVRL